MRNPPLKTIDGAPSWEFSSDLVEACLTREGGHLAPVRFHTSRGVVQPYAIAPWATQADKVAMEPPLKYLRGDFFCAPFGGNDSPWQGERHSAHGETACAPWACESIRREGSRVELVARMQTTVRPGTVTKRICLLDGETNVYCSHRLEGLEGPMPLGHHAMLRFDQSAGQIALSPFRYAQVCPTAFEQPALGGYNALKTGAKFRSLRSVPLAAGGHADLSVYPAREGFEDLVMLCARDTGQPAWSAVVFPEQGWMWFSIKAPRLLASTVLWHSNGGRHYPPWSGRHRRVLGIEEVTAYFHFGLAQSARANRLADRGIPTALHLRADTPLTIPYIMGVAELPEGFDWLRSIRLEADCLVARSRSGKTLHHPVNLNFINAHS